jgi:hypothetical protein
MLLILELYNIGNRMIKVYEAVGGMGTGRGN